MYLLKASYHGEIYSKKSELFIEASLIKVFIRAKFQVEIPKYGLTAKIGSVSENSLKTFDLLTSKLGGRTFFMVGMIHQSLQDAQVPTQK
jgi:hypothetical protein